MLAPSDTWNSAATRNRRTVTAASATDDVKPATRSGAADREDQRAESGVDARGGEGQPRHAHDQLLAPRAHRLPGEHLRRLGDGERRQEGELTHCSAI